MADTSIGGLVMVWGDEPPRVTLPVRCLEDELLPDVSALPAMSAPTALGRHRAARIKATVQRRWCAGCKATREVEGTGYCAGRSCVALRDGIARASRDGSTP